MYTETIKNRLVKMLFIIVFLIPVCVVFSYIHLYGVNLPYWDEWGLIPLFEKFYNGNMTLSDLFTQHNEHRIFFPKILFLLVLYLSKYNTIMNMYLTFILLCINLIIFYKKALLPTKDPGYLLWLLPVSFLVFNLRQWDNLLYGIQLALVMPLTFAILTFYFISASSSSNYRLNYLLIISAFISGTISTFSALMGLFVWPASSLQIFISKKNKKNLLIIWIILSILEWVGYFFRYKDPGGGNFKRYYSGTFLNFPYYFITAIGNFYTDKHYAFIAGIILIILFILCIFYLYRKKSIEKNSFWIIISIYSLLTIMSISVGRYSLGIDQALSSRYTTYSITFIIALYMIIINLPNKTSFTYFLKGTILGLIILGIGGAYFTGFNEGKNIKCFKENLIPIILNYEKASDEHLIKAYPSTEFLKEKLVFFKMHDCSIFNKNFLKITYPEYIFIQKKEDIIKKIEFNKYGKWDNTVYPGIIPPDGLTPEDPFVEYILGSYVNSDKDTGLLKSNSFKISTPSYLIIYVMYGPDKKEQVLGIDTNNDDKIDIYYNNNSCYRDIWYKWFLDLANYSGNDIKIIVEDNGDAWGQWIGVSQPILYKKTDK